MYIAALFFDARQLKMRSFGKASITYKKQERIRSYPETYCDPAKLLWLSVFVKIELLTISAKSSIINVW